MKFDDAEKYRSPHPLGFKQKPGDDFGWFIIPSPRGSSYGELRVQAAPDFMQYGWEHVSVSHASRTPTWDEMCFIKDLFWDAEDVVVQFHPKKSEYVNLSKNCLHLWRKIGEEFPTPSSILVGPK